MKEVAHKLVKDEILEANPWIAQSLYNAFSKAKALWLTKLRSGEANTAGDKKYRQLSKIVGDDPLPFGMKQNLATIQALEDTAFKQKLTPRRTPIADIFVDPEKT